MEEHKKRRMIKMYLRAPNVAVPASIAGVGVVLLILGMLEIGGLATLSGVVLFVALYGAGGATESQVDTWFAEDLAKLQRAALDRIGLDEDDLEGDPVMVVGPILWKRPGIDDDELVWKRGRDKIARFSIYRVIIVFLTEHFMNCYSCDFNFLRNVALNEHDSQYHYKDVVSVSKGEIAQSCTLSTGEDLNSSEGFCLSFTNGDKISVTVSAEKLKDITKADFPTNAVEKAVRTIRTMLKAKI
jgi:hypothetical protein